MDLGRRWIASVALLAAAGCASAPKPVDTLARSEAAVRSAQVMGAEQNPTAALHLRLAQEQLQAAYDARLERAHLERAELRGATLKYAHLDGADLRNADLRDAT